MSRSRFFQRGVELFNILIKESKGFDNVAKKLEVETFKKGHFVCSLVVSEEHTNKMGTLHGGFTATVVDIATTIAIMSQTGKPGVSVELSVNYMKAAKIGEEIKFDAKCIKAGKSLAFTTTDITSADGTLLAQGKHVKFFAHNAPTLFSADDEVD